MLQFICQNGVLMCLLVRKLRKKIADKARQRRFALLRGKPGGTQEAVVNRKR